MHQNSEISAHFTIISGVSTGKYDCGGVCSAVRGLGRINGVGTL